MSHRPHSRSAEHVDRLIARCLSRDTEAAVRDIQRGGLWEYVTTRACDSRLGGALLAALQAHDADPPAATLCQLQAYREHVIAANDYMVRRVTPALASLREHDVPVLLLKGAALNAVLYPPGQRAMVDVDGLVHPRDVGRADLALRSCGCTPGEALLSDDFFPRYYHEREYFTPHGPAVKIDLHARPFRPLRYLRTVPDDALWHEPQPVTVGGVEVRIPDTGNMLIHLAVHAACHGLTELRWLYDIALWIERFGPRIDADAVAARCRAWKIELPMRRALERTEALFGASLPGLSRGLAGIGRGRLADRLLLRQAPHDAARPVRCVLANLLTTPGPAFRLGYLESVLLPGPEHLGQLYRRRHRGWQLAAHAVRAARAVARPFLPPPAEPA